MPSSTHAPRSSLEGATYPEPSIVVRAPREEAEPEEVEHPEISWRGLGGEGGWAE